jgi:CheY-like chemotaxis protein
VKWGPCSPRTLLNEVISLMRLRAAAKNLSLELECPGTIPETILSDSIRLRQILINLVGNAVKFTEKGHVRVIAKFVETDAGPPLMQFDIVDTGIGMSAEQVSRLFQPFSQADSQTSHKFGGTGLGLAISKRLAELLGGGITVRSSAAKGSTFQLTVSAGSQCGMQIFSDSDASQEAIGGGQSADHATPETLPKLPGRLLLAEDGPDNQRLISLVLQKAGTKVDLAENGKIALDLALEARRNNEPFDLILMDMQMPVMDGYEATRKLREEGFTTPIVALTAHAMAGDRERCLEAGCDDYISKPVERTSLLNNLSRYMPEAVSVR